MNRRARVAAAVLASLVILGAGVAYAVLRPATYQSTSRLVLVPKAKSLNDISNLTSSFSSSGTAETLVELIASKDTVKSAGADGLDVGVRAVPSSRVIAVNVAGGDQKRLQPALNRLLDTARREQTRLNDAWGAEVLEGAQTPSRSGPSAGLVLLATLLLAVFGGVLVLFPLRGLAPPPHKAWRPKEMEPGAPANPRAPGDPRRYATPVDAPADH